MKQFNIFANEFEKEMAVWMLGYKDLKYSISIDNTTNLCVCEVKLYRTEAKRAIYIDEDFQPGYTAQRQTGDRIACEMCFFVTGNAEVNI